MTEIAELPASKESCRLCDEYSDKLISVFEKNDEGKQIMQLIKDCLPIIIYRSDPLSKGVCESCLDNLENYYRFKSVIKEIDEKHREKIQSSPTKTKNQLLYLAIENDENKEFDSQSEDNFIMHGMADASTSTDELPMLCMGCNKAISEIPSTNGDIEMNGKDPEECEKVLRSRRKKPQPFYHELDDSICSSMTEFTQNTESSHCFEDRDDLNDNDSVDSEDRGKKRRRDFDEKEVSGAEILLIKKSKLMEAISEPMEEDIVIPPQEEDFIYNPLSLLKLCLNIINIQNVPGYVPGDFYKKPIKPKCRHCSQQFQNSKILALHEVCHMDVVVDDKVDNPAIWSPTRKNADIRNKWLAYFDENGYEEDDLILNQSLLIPIEMSNVKEDELEENVVLVTLDGIKPVVKGIPLSEYPKEERKNFYQSLVVAGQKKRFCQICRYTFKDNWAIESHYFSSACYYTCKYCGMRFNKQRHRFDEHMQEHVIRGDPIVQDKIYAPSKINNYMPKVIGGDKTKKLPLPVLQPNPHLLQSALQGHAKSDKAQDQLRVRAMLNRRSLPNLQSAPKSALIKKDVSPPPPAAPSDQVKSEVITSQSKTGNQAYFCRKCYKVFFKLDEFNVHNKNCDFNQFPGFVASKPPPMQFNTPPKPAPAPKPSPKPSPKQNGETPNRTSNSTRPVRNCTKDMGPYKDEAYIPEVLLKETAAPSPRGVSMQGPPFVCFICGTPFPTVYSRNSHMRIHKGETSANNSNSSPSTSKPKQQNNYNNYPDSFMVKQEPLEPEVQIHESEPTPPLSQIGNGAVSITPIPKKNNQRLSINPDIYKLVQDNPNISLQKKNPENKPQIQSPLMQMQQQMQILGPNEDKSYKCSSCWEAFANKSHLYFHKKNQCEGSRFPCPFCKKRFGTEAAYSSHIFYSHPE